MMPRYSAYCCAHHQVQTLRRRFQTAVYLLAAEQVAEVETSMPLGDVRGAVMAAPTANASMAASGE